MSCVFPLRRRWQNYRLLPAICHPADRAVGLQVMTTSAPFTEFAARLHQALDYAGFAKGRSRTGALAAHHAVSRETARKWLGGFGLPELERLIAIATENGVSFEWLVTGRGSMRDVDLSVREPALSYGAREEMRIIGLVRKLSAKRRKALLELLDE